MKTYLSIDMDFWNGRTTEYVESDLDALLRELHQRNVPMIAVMNHQQLTNVISASSARVLINVDMHSDLADTGVDVFECGTWVSYVKWRKHGKYAWIHRHPAYEGECNSIPIFAHGVKKHLSDWKHITHNFVRKLPPVQELVSDCVGAGLVLSPSYVYEEYEPIFRKLVQKYNIPYKRGRRNEPEFLVDRKPK